MSKIEIGLNIFDPNRQKTQKGQSKIPNQQVNKNNSQNKQEPEGQNNENKNSEYEKTKFQKLFDFFYQRAIKNKEEQFNSSTINQENKERKRNNEKEEIIDIIDIKDDEDENLIMKEKSNIDLKSKLNSLKPFYTTIIDNKTIFYYIVKNNVNNSNYYTLKYIVINEK